LVRERSYEENAGKFVEMNESLHYNGRGTFRTFTVKKDVPK